VGRTVAHGVETVLALAFLGGVCLNFTEVLGRHFFSYSFMGADEVQVYVMVAMTFVGAALVSWRQTHLRMDVLAASLPAGVRRVLPALEIALVAAVSAFALFHSARYAIDMHTVGSTSNNAKIPLWIPHALVAAGFAGILIVTLVRAVQLARRAA
jgi:TRAP-type C4-dicarboxylate transport system permease small subunit